MSLRLTVSVVSALLSASLFAQQSEERKSPVNIRSITLHEEGKEARSVDIESATRDFVPTSTRELDGSWAITSDTGGGLSVENQPVTIRTSTDGSITAEFASETACPHSSGARTRYFKGKIEGGAIVGTIDRCTSKAFVEKCGDADVYSVGFRADVRDVDTMVGRFTGTGYRITGGGCVEDSAYDREHMFELRRISGTLASAAGALTDQTAGDPAPSQCRPIDLDRYCGETYGGGYSAIYLEPGTSNGSGWRCAPQLTRSGGDLESVSYDDACTSQHGLLAEPKRQHAGRDGMCCELPPSTPVRVFIKSVNVYQNGDLFGKGSVKVTFRLWRVSRSCGQDDLNYGDCDDNLTLSQSRKVRDNTIWEIGWESPVIEMFADEGLLLAWEAVEIDTVTGNETCLRPSYWAFGMPNGEMSLAIGREDQLRDRIWLFQTEFPPVSLAFFDETPVGTIRFRSVNPDTGIPTGPTRHYDSSGGDWDRGHNLYCTGGQPLTEELLWLGLEFYAYPDYLDRNVLHGSVGDDPGAPEPVSDDLNLPKEN